MILLLKHKPLFRVSCITKFLAILHCCCCCCCCCCYYQGLPGTEGHRGNRGKQGQLVRVCELAFCLRTLFSLSCEPGWYIPLVGSHGYWLSGLFLMDLRNLSVGCSRTTWWSWRGWTPGIRGEWSHTAVSSITLFTLNSEYLV